MVRTKNGFYIVLVTFFTVLVAIGTGLCGMSVCAENRNIVQTFGLSGKGTSLSPFKIYTASDLNSFASYVNSGNASYQDCYVVLENDINLAAYTNYTPIGNSSRNHFRGVFNGQGHTISNLTITAGGTPYLGLFGYASAKDDFTIENFSMTNVKISVTSSLNLYVGAVLGYCYVDNDTTSSLTSNIKNVAVKSGTLTAKTTGSAYQNGGTSFVGGIVGATNITYPTGAYPSTRNPLTNTLEIECCYSKVTFPNCSSAIAVYKGGIIGNGYVFVSNCYSINNTIRDDSGTTLTNNTSLMCIRFSYYVINFSTINQQYYYYGKAGTLVDSAKQGFRITSEVIWGAMIVSSNSMANIWVIEIPDNPSTEGEVILKNVGNKYSTSPKDPQPTDPGGTGGGSGETTGGGGEEPTTPVAPATSATITANYRSYDIETNSWDIFKTKEVTINLGEVLTLETVNGVNRDFLSLAQKPYFVFEKGSHKVEITNSTLVIVNDYLNYAKNGYTLDVNYINGCPVLIKNEQYWLANDSNYMFTFNASTGNFSKITVLNNANIISTRENCYFLGWSPVNSNQICEFANVTENNEYIDWRVDVPLIIKAERNHLKISNDYTITGIKCNTTDSAFIAGQIVALYEVWGDMYFRCNTKVYKQIDGVNLPEPRISIFSDMETGDGYFRMKANTSHNLSLKDNYGNTIDDNQGYSSITWTVGTISEDGVVQSYGESKFGKLTSSTTAITTISNAKTETSIVVVLVPKTGIKVSLNINNDFPGAEEVVYKIKNVSQNVDAMLLGSAELVYGETYTITVENLVKGFYVSSAKINNTNYPVEIDLNKITFTADEYNGDIVIDVAVSESVFYNLFLYSLYALATVSVLIIILTLSLKAFHPKFDYEIYIEEGGEIKRKK